MGMREACCACCTSFLGIAEIRKDSRLFLKKATAEFGGVFLLVFIGCASCLNWHGAPPLEVSTVQIALAFGLTVGTIVQCISHCSGGHINPAVTCAMFVTRKISFLKFLAYVLAQCLGAIGGAALLRSITPADANTEHLGLTTVNSKLTPIQGVGVEFIITFILVFTVFAVCDGERRDVNGSAPLAIGIAVATCHLAAVKYTGSSMNPARTFGPAVITGIWQYHWVYWLGPCLGGIAAGILYHHVFRAPAPQPIENSLSPASERLLIKDPKEVITERTTAM